LTTEAKQTTSSPRRRGAAKQTTTCRDDMALSWLFHPKGQPLGLTTCIRNRETLAKPNYLDFLKKWTDRQHKIRKEQYQTEKSRAWLRNGMTTE
jgi:hypothetical protein